VLGPVVDNRDDAELDHAARHRSRR
jgi:hypothetical protein